MYSRDLDGQTLTFGVSGKLWKNALVMYDRETRSLWSHMTGECLDGSLKGKRLEMVSAVPIVTWRAWRRSFPNTKVLTIRGREDQRRDNYLGYHGSSQTGLFPTENHDRRLDNKDLVIGVSVEGRQKAYPIGKKHWKTAKQKVWKLVEDEIAGIPILVYHDPENYASSVYKRTVGDSVLVFGEGVKGAMARDIGGSVWNLLTGAGSEGRSLVPVPHLNIYWYAWADFYPDAELYKH